MDFTTLTIELLKNISAMVGNYGVGIIVLTFIIRLLMWPLGVSQQRSMKTMQTLQPKMKAIQDRYKSDPQVMQKKMMEFYKEHKFNPMAGCLPLLLQMPIFILLYTALMSPQFIQVAGDSQFLFIKRLDATLRGHAGVSYDGSFGISKLNTFVVDKKAKKVYLGNETLEDVKILDPKKALKVQGELKPGENIDFKISLDELDLKYSQLEKIKKIEVNVTDNATREIETITFDRKGDILVSSMPSTETKSAFNIDVLILILFFGGSMWVTQKIMMAQNKGQQVDPTQEAMQKTMGTMMPIMLTATFIFIPIPAGVLLYLITSNLIQVGQTMIINKQLEAEDKKKKAAKKEEIIDVTPEVKS